MFEKKSIDPNEKISHKELNKTTLKALKETDSGIGLHKFKSLDEMFEDLEI